jgi:hypothetical protein
MIEPSEISNDLQACQALLRVQAESLSQQSATIASQARNLDELRTEMEKLRKLLSHFVNGHRSEKRILPTPDQKWLPFENSEEFQAARAEAETQAEAIVQTYTVTRTAAKKKRDESLPSHLPRVERVIEGDDAQKNCPAHGERKVIGYDKTETLVYKRPELYVLVKKYAKYACLGNPTCGVASPERPTSLVEGDRYDTSVAATVVEAKWFHHSRRKVVESTTYPKESELLLGMIQALYDIETRAKDLTWQDRQALRQRESTVVLDAIWRWLETRPLQDVLPKSDFAEALRYIRNHWKELNVYVGDGRIPIDNNSVEQLMKQVAMGRKAWLFVCGVTGGEQSAMMMTLVSSARRHDLDVGVYVKDVLDQLLAGSTDYDRLLPDVWKQSHPEAIREYRVEERRDKADRKQFQAARRRLAAR